MSNKTDIIINHIKKRYIFYKDIPFKSVKKIKQRYSLKIIESFFDREVKRINNENT